jgi:hypothetical protein
MDDGGVSMEQISVEAGRAGRRERLIRARTT